VFVLTYRFLPPPPHLSLPALSPSLLASPSLLPARIFLFAKREGTRKNTILSLIHHSINLTDSALITTPVQMVTEEQKKTKRGRESLRGKAEKQKNKIWKKQRQRKAELEFTPGREAAQVRRRMTIPSVGCLPPCPSPSFYRSPSCFSSFLLSPLYLERPFDPPVSLPVSFLPFFLPSNSFDGWRIDELRSTLCQSAGSSSIPSTIHPPDRPSP